MYISVYVMANVELGLELTKVPKATKFQWYCKSSNGVATKF